MISFERNSFDISIIEKIISKNFLDECVESSDYKDFSVQDEWKHNVDDFSFDGLIDIHPALCDFNKAKNNNVRNINPIFTEKILPYVESIFYNDMVSAAGQYFYPPTGYMSWHTNHRFPCHRVYITYASEDKKSFFRYRDPETGNIITDYDDKGITVRKFFVPFYPPYFWHCVGSECDRISFGFRLLPKN